MEIKFRGNLYKAASEHRSEGNVTPVDELKVAIKNLIRNLDGLREFIVFLEPAATQRWMEIASKHKEDLLPMTIAANQLNPELVKLSDETQQKIVEAGLEGVVQETKTTEAGIEISMTVPGHYSDRFRTALEAVDKAGKHPELLRRSALISLVSIVEWYTSEILHIFARNQPQIFDHTEKEITLQELVSFKSIEEAKSYYIEAKVESVLRGSIADWLKFLSSRVHLSMTYVQDLQQELEEVCNRRNLLVHNGGVVNKIYLSKTKNTNLNEGEEVHVTRDYLDRSVALFESIFILIAAEWWKRVAGDDESRSELLTEISLEAINEERYQTGEWLSKFVMYDKGLSEKSRLIGQVNYWQARKWTGQFEEVKTEIERFDVSAKEPIFLTVKNVLLGKLDEAFKEIDILIERQELSIDSLHEWPIFREVRLDERFKKYPTIAKE